MRMKPMSVRNFLLLILAAALLSSCSHRRDAVFEHFQDLETELMQATNEWQLVQPGALSIGEGVSAGDSAACMWVLKHRVDADRFRAAIVGRIERFVAAQGGTVVASYQLPGQQVSQDYRSKGADSSGQMILYRLGPHRGFISARLTVFDRDTEAGHFYLEQSSLR